MVGDCLYNLRSSLDHLVYELALAHNSGQPLPGDVAEGLEFPIFGPRPMKDGERKRKIGALSPAAQAVIEGMQPHRYGERYAGHHLWQLHALCNWDKHRLPHLVGSASTRFGVGSATGVTFETLIAPQRVVAERGAELVRFRVAKPAKADVYFEFAFVPAFAEGPPGYGAELLPALLEFCQYVETMVWPPLRDHLSAAPRPSVSTEKG